MRIKWHRKARQDLRNIRVYIAEDNPKAAANAAATILQAVELLPENSAIGRPGRVIDTRELVVAGTPYLVPYRVMGDVVVILRVLHGAQKWPETFGNA
jgi:toxin ParE1/3/4